MRASQLEEARRPTVRRRRPWGPVAAALVAVAFAAAPAPAQGARAPGAEAVPAPPAAVVGAGLAGRGSVARRERGLLVKRVALPARMGRASGRGGSVFRLRLAGRYPPRALRYIVRAGGRPVGYGIPAPNRRALRAVTANRAVLSAPIAVRYEGAGSVSPPPPDPASALGQRRARAAALPGPFAVRRAVYDLGERAFRLSRLRGRVEGTADVHFPRGLVGGPFPLVLFMHGNHESCYRGLRVRYKWPCRRRFKPLPNYAGYDYIAERLASFGFIVASVSANGVNVLGNQVRDTGMRQRGELLQRHVGLWRRWASTGGDPFGSRFVGKVDLDRIGVMGHSRGGEGAVWQVIVDRRRATPYGIDAVLPLAPVDFTRRTVNRVPLAVMLPYCDGDVSDLQGVHFFDDARYRTPGDPSPKHTVTAFGANHNFFNTVWSPGHGYPGGFDDGARGGPCRDRLSQTAQRRVGAAFVVSFFRRYLAEALELDPVWTGAQPAPDIEPARALVSYLAPDTPERRLDVDRFTSPGDLAVNELGGSVIARRLPVYRWCPDTHRRPCVPGRFSSLDVHLPGLARGVLGWSSRASRLRFEIPLGQGDVRGLDALQFRVAPNPGYAAARLVRRQDLVVALLDGTGNRAEIPASAVRSRVLALPSGLRRFEGHVILNQLRFPLSRFEGVDLGDLRAVELRFSRTPRGVIDIADLAFTSGAAE